MAKHSKRERKSRDTPVDKLDGGQGSHGSNSLYDFLAPVADDIQDSSLSGSLVETLSQIESEISSQLKGRRKRKVKRPPSVESDSAVLLQVLDELSAAEPDMEEQEENGGMPEASEMGADGGSDGPPEGEGDNDAEMARMFSKYGRMQGPGDGNPGMVTLVGLCQGHPEDGLTIRMQIKGKRTIPTCFRLCSGSGTQTVRVHFQAKVNPKCLHKAILRSLR